MRPQVLLADEPTGSLDTSTGRSILELFRAANADGQTVVLVTHDPKIAAGAGRVLFLRDGRLVRDTHVPDRPADPHLLARMIAAEDG